MSHIETVDSLEKVSAFLKDYPVSQDKAAKDVGRLAEWWLNRARLQLLVDQHSYQFRELESRAYQVVVFPAGAKMQESIDSGAAINVAMSDPGLAFQEAISQLQTHVGVETG